jgi:hypothetical protein
VVVALAFALLSFIPLIGGLIGIGFGVIVTLIVNAEAALPVALLMVALLAISLGVQLLGFWGVIFGVPFAGAVYALLFDFYLPRRQGLPQPATSEPSVAAQVAAHPKGEDRGEDVVAPALKRSSS